MKRIISNNKILIKIHNITNHLTSKIKSHLAKIKTISKKYSKQKSNLFCKENLKNQNTMCNQCHKGNA